MWDIFFEEERNKQYFKQLEKTLNEERNKYQIYPDINDTFNAFSYCNFKDLKVVIIGQDPYHTKGVADGLAFSSKSNKIPPSLKNIYKELENDLGIKRSNPNLINWAKQGVFLINTYLSVRQGKPLSHKDIGWDIFVKNCIKYISNNKENVCFLLWGNFAINTFINLIDNKKHLILTSSHPSPFSAKKTFFNSKCFSKVNNYLIKNNLDIINW